jgi:hypothetical protein
MAIKLEYPLKNSSSDLSSGNMQPGKSKVPLRIELAAEQYSNNATTRAKGGKELIKIILPLPTEGMNNSVAHAYNQAPAKEESLLVKAWTGEATSILRDAWGFIGKQFEDAITTVGGIDYGRIPADMSESTYSGSDKRGWNFTWDLISLSKSDSNQLVTIANELTSYSLPGAKQTTDRAQAPPTWRIKVLSDNGKSTRGITRALLGDPKLCVLTSCSISRDTTSLYAPSGSNNFPTPLAMQLKLNFQEIEPVYGQDGKIRSRSEIRTGGSFSSID